MQQRTVEVDQMGVLSCFNEDFEGFWISEMMDVSDCGADGTAAIEGPRLAMVLRFFSC